MTLSSHHSLISHANAQTYIPSSNITVYPFQRRKSTHQASQKSVFSIAGPNFTDPSLVSPLCPPEAHTPVYT